MFDIAGEAALIDRIAELERSKSAAAAEQAVLTAELDAARRSREAARGVPAAKRGKGLASEIALARRDSPNRGGRHLGFARALVHEMPHTLAALHAGLLSEWRATLIVRESACLSVEDRATLDARMCADQASLEGKGDKRIDADAKAIAYELDPQAIVDRAVRAESERTVTSRPAPDNMAYVTALLPMPQGVAVYAALRREADTCGDGRGRGQVMADTLVERITGRPADVPVPVAATCLPGSRATDRFPPRWRGAWSAQRCRTGRRGRRCGDCIATPHPVPWSRWNRGPGCSRRGWRGSSTPATTPAAPRTATPRSAITTTLNRITATDRPVR